MNTIKKRRQFTREFKIEAVEFLLRGKKSAIEVSRDLGIRTSLLHRWKREYLNNTNHSFPGTGHLHDQEEEKIRQLERENRSLQEERDISKKALAIFSRTPRCLQSRFIGEVQVYQEASLHVCGEENVPDIKSKPERLLCLV